MDQKKIGLFIRDLRKEKGMSQKQFAAILNVSESAVCKWEKGVNLPDTFNLHTISDMFQITVNELLAGKRMPVPELKLKSESEPDPSLKLTSELEANSGEYEETNPGAEQKPESGLTLAADPTDAENQSKIRILRWKRIWALCSLCILVMITAFFTGQHQDNNSAQFTVVESYYGEPDERSAKDYGLKYVYWVMVEYDGPLNSNTAYEFSRNFARKFDMEDTSKNVDAILFQYYKKYSKNTAPNQDSIIFLPFIDVITTLE